MKVVEFAQMLRYSIEQKINQYRGDISESHNAICNKSLMVEIETLEWVQ